LEEALDLSFDRLLMMMMMMMMMIQSRNMKIKFVVASILYRCLGSLAEGEQTACVR